MSYSGGLRWGYAELMQMNGIPLYPGVGPETGFKYRCKLRPHGSGGGVWRQDNEWWVQFIGFRDTRAQAAQAVYEGGR